jgi:hypothetical protein
LIKSNRQRRQVKYLIIAGIFIEWLQKHIYLEKDLQQLSVAIIGCFEKLRHQN